MSRILFVEDNDRLAELIIKALVRVGIEVDAFGDIASASQAAGLQNYAALILDRNLPDGDGITLLRRLREGRNGIPCLILTARGAVHDRVEGLDHGADDYLAKPFAMEELVARVKALVRRPAEIRSDHPVLGDLELRPDEGIVVRGPSSVVLAPVELQILLCLMQADGRMVQRRRLEQTAWGLSDAVTPNALDVAIHRLRKKLLGIGSTVIIVNLRAQGYSLHATTEHV
ncbi:transcriptional regulator [Skermanella stibiiresistens SB22]|uniref:Transcriptional regulator n=1 Tax=Skermanella stibiiresistens SB22 TaxID=1385369 RepID=W9GVY3_9PROT|nr:response regulator transcription factor [Skermanella stibiiresistens]EWY37974.1 transcriptional regulator [Skermanella stibiiresistens SB22]